MSNQMSMGSKRPGWRAMERRYNYLTRQLKNEAAAARKARLEATTAADTPPKQAQRLITANTKHVAVCVRCATRPATFTARAPNGSWDAICRPCITLDDRWFAGCFPCGIVYADCAIEEHGDYKRVAFISYSKLELEIDDPSSPLIERVKADAARIQAMRDQDFAIAGNMTITLGRS